MVKVVDDGVFNASREKVWQLLDAHSTDITKVHPGVKSSRAIRKEGNSEVVENQMDMGGQVVKIVMKVTANPPDRLTLEFLEGPMKGKMVNTYSDVPGGTKVNTEADMKSDFMNDQQLESAVKQFLNQSFDEDTRYLSKMK